VRVVELSSVAYIAIMRWLNSALPTRTQRALLSAGALALLPWVAMRTLREPFRTYDMHDYLRKVVGAPMTAWFDPGWNWSETPYWYDRWALPAAAVVALAFAWRRTGARLIAWILAAR